MSYQALYRVWRPQRFDDLVGQQIVTRTLKNAIITHQISHAYLFAGPRGTGKTSAAKIFAKAVNCHHSKDGEPCNECDICKAITNGQLNDVIEIDAASNNGVEEIRDIRDKAKYAPTQADYKVYIIDEVHMLSTGAFNALLKTLEEPPANVIFILATTEPHKIPLTIISRVQRFDFRRISAEDAFNRMKYILDQKKVTYDEKALWVIANAAEGGMRDALSILDQVLSFSDNEVKLDDALLVTGSVTKQLLKKYFLEISKHEGATALDSVESTGLKQEDFEEIVQLASSATLYQMIDELNNIQEEMRFTTHPDVYLEVLTIKLAQIEPQKNIQSAPAVSADTNAEATKTIEKLQQEIQQLQQTVKQLQNTPVRASRPSPRQQNEQPRVQQKKVQVNLNKIYPVLENATRQDLINVRELWGDMLNLLSVPQRSLLHVSQPVAASAAGIIVAFDYPFLFQQAADDTTLLENMESALQRLTGNERQVVFVPKDKWPKIRQDFIKDHGFGKNQQKSQPIKQKPQTTEGSGQTPAATPAPMEEPPLPPEDEALTEETSPQEDNQVATAQKLFGSDIVKVEDN